MDGGLRLLHQHTAIAFFPLLSSPCRSTRLHFQPYHSYSSPLNTPTIYARCRAAAEPQPRRKSEKVTLPDFFEIDRDAAAFDLIFESTQASKTARHYEVVFLIHENHEEEVQDVIQKVKDFIEEKKGKIYRLNDWGMRKLAYKIKKSKRAHYILMNIEIEGRDINEFKSLLDKEERVIRHLVMTKKQAETKNTVSPPEFSSIRDDYESDEYEEEYEETDDEAEETEEMDDEAEEIEEAEEVEGVEDVLNV